MSVPCACGMKGCRSMIVIASMRDYAILRAERRTYDDEGKLRFDNMNEESIRLDGSGLVALIREAKEALINLAQEKEDF